MAFASATVAEAEFPRFQRPALSVRRPRRLVGKGLVLGLVAAGTVATLAVSLSLAAVWTRAVSHTVPTTLHAGATKAPLVSALGDWHRTMIRAAVHSGPANGFGSAPDTEPDEFDLAPLVAPKLLSPAPLPHPVETMPPLPASPPAAVAPRPEVVPLPRRRPHIAEAEPAPQPAVVARAAPEPVPVPEPKPAPEPAVAAAPQPSPAAALKPKLASLPPIREPKAPISPIDHRTAVYDIEGRTVYMPNGRRLEAHSGLGEMMDDPRYIHAKNRGPTPPNVYALTMRESLFHGVRAIRLTPVDETKMFGRDGMLAHTYMLGPNGQSNGCVSFKNYDAFLQAFLDGEVNRMVVVSRLDARTRTALSLPASRGLFSAFAAD